MCGIAGLFNCNLPADELRLDQAVAKLTHRGPDDRGIFLDGRFGMGHTRLSIIDLAGGHQPLFSEDRRLALIANGEIYNFIELRSELTAAGFRFQTQSDSEVILHAYLAFGEGFLERIQGMFAFALYDALEGRLILARDRLGIKPLFLARRPDGIAFASEIKALLPLLDQPREIDPQGLAQYFQNQFSTGATTVLRGVERVLPGEAVVVEAGKTTRRFRYWSPLAVRTEELDFDEAAARFDALMERVMVEHMRSDVPFGLFLSGGVDSSLLLALLTRYSGEPIRTFSVGFPGTSLTDELPLAEGLARRFRSRHREIRPGPQDILHSLPLTVWAADDLMRDNASLPTSLLARAAGEELKVVFSGEGGDEVFAGYGRYRTSPLERLFKSLLAPGSGGFRTRGSFRGRWPKTLFGPALLAAAQSARRPVQESWRETPREWSDLQRMQYVDLCHALPDNLLVKADRMLMAWGVEGRVPFLDHRVVEFGLSLPDRLKIEGRQGKLFLKRWGERLVPAEQLYARKRGFHVPLGEWLDEPFLERLNRILPEHPALTPWFKPAGIRALIARCRDERQGSAMLWAIIQFAIWHRLFISGNGERPEALTDPLEILQR
ncbi:asparagine synthetase, glutamine-hydrolyzing [Methylococcus capsulatus str. Bath]|uniref:asparagine synthase (glutamine-hydrolyzing) n=1 Tax=Methylococcus capsulatus (strain ATCC 33009 / NCIMB 11132 / Bath) TaxID=243233 RepID=Q60BD5_METCA|nr:asparagine synthase (glutamine-hydrolyzing) [Methylococcus capsulatus]AAU93268.1 asparagine synthetase, glutamine-hydrolyzing [Methylococcus capsulatus str. Bath]